MHFRFVNLSVFLLILLLCRKSVSLSQGQLHTRQTQTPFLAPPQQPKQVAIIGAGAAGSSAAYYLNKYAKNAGVAVNITVLERSDYIGGRSTTVNVYNDTENIMNRAELGASIFVKVNQILQNASAEFNLTINGLHSADDDPRIVGVWNGVQFVYQSKEGGWAWWDLTKLLWKYGMAPIRTQNLMKATISKFLKLYSAPFFPFRSLIDRTIDLDLISTTARTGQEFLEINNVKGAFTTDIIQAGTRVNYAQNLGVINGLLTMVCMAGSEGADQVQGGNWQIFDRMLKSSEATVLLNTTVTKVSKTGGKYVTEAFSDKRDMNWLEDMAFDSVVLAAPLQFSNITLDQGTVKRTPDEILYVKLHVTLFTSSNKLNPNYFGVKEPDEMPNTVLTTTAPEHSEKIQHVRETPDFFSISTLRKTKHPVTNSHEYLYKIFSPEMVTSRFLEDLFGMQNLPSDISLLNTSTNPDITWFRSHIWNAYPIEKPRTTFEELELGTGFYYTSGIESFISTMETSALMGMNIAQLIVDDFLEILPEIW